MTTLKQLAELIMRRIAGGDIPQDFPWDEREIIIASGQVRDNFFYQDLFQNMKDGEKGVSPELLTVYLNQEVQEDEELDLLFTELPAKYISLPHDKGVWHVSMMKNQTDVFYRRPQGGNSIYGKLDGSDLAGKIGFWVGGGRIYYIGLPANLKNKKKILIKLISKTQDIDPDAELPVGSNFETQIVEAVYAQYARQVPKDRVTDTEDQKT